MGATTSRGKKVAPESVSEVMVTSTRVAASSRMTDKSRLKSLKRNRVVDHDAPNCAQRDNQSEGHYSDSSWGDGDVDAELSTVLAESEVQNASPAKESRPKKSLFRSKAYGLCHFGQKDTGEEPFRETRVRCSKDVNKSSNFTSAHIEQNPLTHSDETSNRGKLSEAVSTSERQLTLGCSFPPLPVILYDGSEEELMDTIEREFS